VEVRYNSLYRDKQRVAEVKCMKRISFCAAVLIFISILLGGCKARKTNFVTIGTGGVTGIYYPTGGAISNMVNKKFDEYKIKATVESTSGSVFNINAVLNGDLEFGVVQSDRQNGLNLENRQT
jgi:TRAP transporter TAXI family solute receptor